MRVWILCSAALLMGGCGSRTSPEAVAPQPSPVKILQFYSNASSVAKGETALVCYGVENAKKVRLEPAIEEISPALTRCISYAPQSSTGLKLIATGADGNEANQTIHIDVVGVAAPPKGELIVSFVASARTVSPGQEVTLCYSTQGAT